MPSAKNVELVKELRKVIGQYSDFFLTEYKGLSVADFTELRKKLRESGAVYQVIKNNIFKLALNNEKVEGLDEKLVGPNAVLFTSDPVSGAKVLTDFLKDKAKAEKIAIKAGYSEGKVVGEDYVKALSTLPSREELLSKLLRTLKNPASRFVRVLQNPVQKLTFAIKAIADKQQ